MFVEVLANILALVFLLFAIAAIYRQSWFVAAFFALMFLHCYAVAKVDRDPRRVYQPVHVLHLDPH